jgi:hypothetical protein
MQHIIIQGLYRKKGELTFLLPPTAAALLVLELLGVASLLLLLVLLAAVLTAILAAAATVLAAALLAALWRLAALYADHASACQCAACCLSKVLIRTCSSSNSK